MKKLVLALTALGLLTTGSSTKAGDREWATAGKVLTGIFAAKVLHDVTQPRHYHRTTTVCATQPTVIYQAPPTVVYQQPATVIYQQPQPTVVYQQQPANIPAATVPTTTQPAQGQAPVVQQPQVIQQPQVVQQPFYVQQPVVVQQPVIVQQPAVVYAAPTVCAPVTTVVRRSPFVRVGGGYGGYHRHHHRGSYVSFGIFR